MVSVLPFFLLLRALYITGTRSPVRSEPYRLLPGIPPSIRTSIHLICMNDDLLLVVYVANHVFGVHGICMTLSTGRS